LPKSALSNRQTRPVYLIRNSFLLDTLGTSATKFDGMLSIRTFLLIAALLYEPLIAQQNGVKVSGRVTSAEGSVFTGSSVYLTMGSTWLTTAVLADGSFEFAGVMPGTYIAMVLGGVSTVPKQVTVSTTDINGIELVDSNWNTTMWGLEQVWSLNGPFRGVIWDAQNQAIHAVNGTTLIELDSLAQKIRLSTPFQSAPTLRLAHFLNLGAVLLAFGTWSSDVRAIDLNGNELWRYTGGAIDDVWAMDLDGDQSDEVIVGFNGNVGVHVLNGDGQLLWKSTDIGNVWHVSAGDVLGQGLPQVVTTSARGQIHVFGNDGNARKDLDPGFYANMVRAGKTAAEQASATIFVGGGSSSGSLRLAALAGDGYMKWTIELSDNRHSIYSTSLAARKPWLAAGLQGGQVIIVDVDRGSLLGAIDGQGFTPETTWMETNTGEDPVLIISSGRKLTAFRVAP
jgi:hypothetical protein